MTWNAEQAANDLERYLLRKEPPAIGAVELAVKVMRERERTTSRSENFKTKYGLKVPVCKWCGYSVGDRRYHYCPNCGAKVVE